MPPNFYNAGDQAIYAAGDFFIPQERYRAAPYQPNNPDEVPEGIPTVYQPQGGGGGGGYTGGISDLTGDFFKTISDRQNRLTELNRPLTTFPSFKGARTSDLDGDPYGLPEMKGFSANEMYNTAAAAKAAGQDTMESFAGITNVDEAMKYADDRIQDHRMRYATGQLGPSVIREKPTLSRRINDFIYGLPFTPSKPQSADQILAEGYTGKPGGGIFGILAGMVDKYGELPRGDQAFIARNMGYTGPTIFGANDSNLSKDVFGMNTRSAFGNYAEAVGEQVDKLGFALSDKGKTGGKFNATFNPETGLFEGPEAELANQRTKMMRAKLNFYQKQTLQRDADRKADAQRMRDELAAAAAAKSKAAALAAIKEQGKANYTPSIHGSTNYGQDSQGNQSFSGDSIGAGNLGFGVASGGMGGPVSNRTGRGRTDYMNGGLADLVDIYD